MAEKGPLEQAGEAQRLSGSSRTLTTSGQNDGCESVKASRSCSEGASRSDSGVELFVDGSWRRSPSSRTEERRTASRRQKEVANRSSHSPQVHPK